MLRNTQLTENKQTVIINMSRNEGLVFFFPLELRGRGEEHAQHLKDRGFFRKLTPRQFLEAHCRAQEQVGGKALSPYANATVQPECHANARPLEACVGFCSVCEDL